MLLQITKIPETQRESALQEYRETSVKPCIKEIDEVVDIEMQFQPPSQLKSYKDVELKAPSSDKEEQPTAQKLPANPELE